jgi:hypothetical protein
LTGESGASFESFEKKLVKLVQTFVDQIVLIYLGRANLPENREPLFIAVPHDAAPSPKTMKMIATKAQRHKGFII